MYLGHWLLVPPKITSYPRSCESSSLPEGRHCAVPTFTWQAQASLRSTAGSPPVPICHVSRYCCTGANKAGFVGEDASESVSCLLVGSQTHWDVMVALARFPTWVARPRAREAFWPRGIHRGCKCHQVGWEIIRQDMCGPGGAWHLVLLTEAPWTLGQSWIEDPDYAHIVTEAVLSWYPTCIPMDSRDRVTHTIRLQGLCSSLCSPVGQDLIDYPRSSWVSMIQPHHGQMLTSRRNCAMLPETSHKTCLLLHPSPPWRRAMSCPMARSSVLARTSPAAPGALPFFLSRCGIWWPLGTDLPPLRVMSMSAEASVPTVPSGGTTMYSGTDEYRMH